MNKTRIIASVMLFGLTLIVLALTLLELYSWTKHIVIILIVFVLISCARVILEELGLDDS